MNSSIGILTGKREHKASPETYYSIQRAFLNTKPKQSNYLFHQNRGSLTSIW